MSCNNCRCKNRPNIGRGAAFNHDSEEIEATIHEDCYKLHETNYLSEYPENLPTDIVEIRFKNTRRSYYQNVNGLDLKQGDIVAVEASPGHDIGVVSLIGDMVAKQIRRVGFSPLNGEYKKIYRKAKSYDIEKWQEAIELEHETMILSRQIAADMGLNMKIGDVEYQGDKIKAIFYYIADERVDFRELIKVFAEKFHIRIEMKQIGARQEAGRIGGLGACGRELCCASWIANFSSVTTNAARTQEISLNPLKLAGQCSKLKCCLTYEYDTYVDARKSFPRLREPLQAQDGEYHLIKSDILAGTMVFSSSRDAMANIVTLPVERVKEIVAINKSGKKVDKLQREEDVVKVVEEPTYRSEEDSITRFDSKRRSKNNRNKNRGGDRDNRGERTQRSGEKSERGERGDRSERGERGDRSERGERGERPQNRNSKNRPAKVDKQPNGERVERAERPERADRPERQERGDRAPRAPRAQRERNNFNKGERQNRGERQERGERGENRKAAESPNKE